MPQPATGPTEGETFPALCGHTHLFPDARCRLQGLPDPQGFAAAPWPIGVDLRFSDAVGADAELRTDDPAGPLLAVPAYTTGAGTEIGQRTWIIREFSPKGNEVELTIGSRAAA
ncbi:hypothetical protein AB0I22_04805 [Streptomyces sp. NPDC050610]|uniref:hypothetical protein n=1 Tax=Streptomyces sp. NPDC050610 TaxID=3157097 RepID=UPI00342BE913